MNRLKLFVFLGLVYFGANLPLMVQDCVIPPQKTCVCACSDIESNQNSEIESLTFQVSQNLDILGLSPNFERILGNTISSSFEFFRLYSQVFGWGQLGFILSERMIC